MKLKKLLCFTLAAILLLACLSGCRNSQSTDPEQTDPKPESTDPKAEKPAPEPPVQAELLSAVLSAKNLGLTVFDNQLVEYLKRTGRSDENFTVSPLSFKAALALAAIGAEGETRDQLLSALGFADLDELGRWYDSVLDGVDRFERFFGGYGGAAAYQVVNSVWSNRDLSGEFRPAYLDAAGRSLRAEAFSEHGAELADAVNRWVNEKTKGLIPKLLKDASDVSAILVNALYLKTRWDADFAKLGDADFTTRSGEVVQKPFMQQESHFSYYEDAATQLVRVPLQGGIDMVFILGDDTDLAEKLSKAEYRLVDVTVPMFDVETSLDKHELCDFLRLMGCGRMFSEDAEFDPMYTAPLFVGDIIQKAKVHVDEEGLEAAAATAVLLCGAAPFEPETPAVFRADRPFSFCVLSGNTELLFWGQIVE